MAIHDIMIAYGSNLKLLYPNMISEESAQDENIFSEPYIFEAK
jgi:hypothetical protein